MPTPLNQVAIQPQALWGNNDPDTVKQLCTQLDVELATQAKMDFLRVYLRRESRGAIPEVCPWTFKHL